jgi:hypothetical protein
MGFKSQMTTSLDSTLESLTPSVNAPLHTLVFILFFLFSLFFGVALVGKDIVL